MACTPKFGTGLDFECLREVIADIRSGTASVATIQKGLWILGSALGTFVSVPSVFGDSPVAEDADLETLCNQVESVTLTQSTFGDDPAKAVDPATIILIAQLVWKLIQQLKNK